MIPQPFEYHAPKSLTEAAKLAAQFGGEGKLLAGGHSLIPLMKLRLAAPRHVIDISRIPELNYIREEQDKIQIGALTTHFKIESSQLLKAKCPLMPETAREIGDAQVRNKGTLGGSLAHADRASAVEQAIQGKSPSTKRLAEAAAHAAEGVEPNGDLFASSEYRAHLARVYTQRALE